MNQDAIAAHIAAQRRFYSAGHTRPIANRIAALRRLRAGIHELEAEILAALKEDLGKSSTEAYLCEVGPALAELRYMLRHVPAFAAPRPLPVSLAQFPGRNYSLPTPYGSVLIISPWNYPFLLALQPAIDAIAAGNTVVIKPSEYTPATTGILEKLFSLCLPPELAAIIPGDHREGSFLLDCAFDHIFFTGGGETGGLVLEKAARHLTPVTLELGGKSPCIVDKTAHVNLAARRIVFGKFLNCGQTCVAPDYLYAHEDIRAPLLAAIKGEVARQYGENPLENPGYGRIVNRRHFDRLAGLIDREKLALGGSVNADTLQIAPTVLDGVTPADPIMQEEIFGPLLPILTFKSLDEVIAEVSSRPHPLAFYLFSEDRRVQRELLHRLQFGGGCINDTILHLASPRMPFGGVGGSGMGAYHGKAGFDAFTHNKSILEKRGRFDPGMRYPPYTKGKDRLLRRLLR